MYLLLQILKNTCLTTAWLLDSDSAPDFVPNLSACWWLWPFLDFASEYNLAPSCLSGDDLDPLHYPSAASVSYVAFSCWSASDPDCACYHSPAVISEFHFKSCTWSLWVPLNDTFQAPDSGSTFTIIICATGPDKFNNAGSRFHQLSL